MTEQRCQPSGWYLKCAPERRLSWKWSNRLPCNGLRRPSVTPSISSSPRRQRCRCHVVQPLRRAAAGALVAAALVLTVGAAPAFAFCSEPIKPSCASDGVLRDNHTSAAACRSKVRDHLEDLVNYRTCLRGLVQQTTEEIHRMRQLIDPQADEPRS